MQCVKVLLIVSILCCQAFWSDGNELTALSSRPNVRILFVGNSLTYTNNLPKLVATKAAENGIKIKTGMLSFANYALEDHWTDGRLQQLISSKKFDIVILQQGPLSQAEGRQMLLEVGAKIHKLCQQNNVKLAFFMVWPARQNYHTFENIIKNYSDAATENLAQLCPVGQVWKEFIDSTGDYSYYGPDEFHPSRKGSQVAADVIYNSLLK
jgi:lysophospholipase L1-like esterase